MRRLIYAALIALSACTPSQQLVIDVGAPLCRGSAQVEQQFRGAAEALVASNHYPSVTYALARRSGVTFAGGVGVADRASQRAADGDTVYQIASVSKLLTGTLAARMIAEGRMDLDAPLTRYWTGRVPTGAGGAPITIRTLLAHTSSLPRNPPVPPNIHGADFSAQVMRNALANTTVADGAAHWVYSNFGYAVVAEALSRAGGATYAELLHDNVTGPLGMSSTAPHLNAAMEAHAATPYHRADPQSAAPREDFNAMNPAAGVWSSANDLARYAAWELARDNGALGEHGAQARTLARTPFDPNAPEVGNAWAFGRYVTTDFVDAHSAVAMAGHVEGFGAMVVIIPDADIAIVFLVNSGDTAPFEEFAKTLARIAIANC